MACDRTRYETRGVLAGAYKGRARKGLEGQAAGPRLLTHSVEVDGPWPTGRDVRVLCNRVPLDHMADSYGGDVNAPPECSVCRARLERIAKRIAAKGLL